MRFRAQRLVLVLVGLSVLFASGCDLVGWKNIGPVRSDGPVSVRTELRSITVDWTSLSQSEQAAAYELTIVDPKGNLVEIIPLDASETNYTFLGTDERSGYYKFTLELLDVTDFSYEIHTVKAFYLNTDLPVMMIDVEGGEFLVEKKPALPSTVRIDPNGTEYDAYEGTGGFRGRGNTTWGYPKKPYRVDLDENAPLLGLASGKKWVLLAEFLEGSMLYNSIAFGAGHALEMPYTNTIVPVELIVNGVYQGMYVLTEQKEVADGRIPSDEVALLLELDAHYDEDWQFKSKGYNLPVMVQYPTSKNMDEERLAAIRAEFEALEAMITSSKFPNTDYLEYLDLDAFVNYMIIYELTYNWEINHPKSTYMHKLHDEDKFYMGIIWDFDWGLGFNRRPKSPSHYNIFPTQGTVLAGYKKGGKFFGRLMSDPAVKAAFKERWATFRNELYDDLKDEVRAYGNRISTAVKNDHLIWGSRGATGDTEKNVKKALTWLDTRAEWLDSYVADW